MYILSNYVYQIHFKNLHLISVILQAPRPRPSLAPRAAPRHGAAGAGGGFATGSAAAVATDAGGARWKMGKICG